MERTRTVSEVFHRNFSLESLLQTSATDEQNLSSIEYFLKDYQVRPRSISMNQC